ncbi:hypothetical protein EPR50_G00033720 [Perca flavescens]|uniref:Uncharacterized protein n=1 Tax=Perca flavescens TaxID=8167 RepID=A0A484DEJ4_PERFV|nr:hypothetical protein EPR50_G00033720 [Perca flavescens]
MLVTATKFNGPKLKRLFERRTPLAAVDIHANMYANAIAQYYNQRSDVPPPDKQGEGDDKEISSSSDDAFEELPVRPKRSSMKKETDYVRVKPGGATRSLDANALLKDSNVYGLGRKGEVRYTSRTKTDKVVKKQGEVGAQSRSGRRDNKEDDDDYEVSYTRVTIKLKH